MQPLAGHANSYHPYAFADALAGIAAAGYSHVELSAVPGWCEHVDVQRPAREVRAALDAHGLEACSISGHSDLTSVDGLAHGLAVVRWAEAFGVPIVNTAVGGHASGSESEAAFLANVGTLADAADAAGVTIALETHGELMRSGAAAAALVERIGRASVRVNYDTANVVFYGGVRPEDDLPAVLPHVAHVHLKDKRGGAGVWDFPAIGEGELDVGRVLALLRAGAYAGPISVEIEFTAAGWPPVPDVDAAMRASRATLAAHGLT
jgi:L-ribulose-5-phosphate 3-epimerase